MIHKLLNFKSPNWTHISGGDTIKPIVVADAESVGTVIANYEGFSGTDKNY